MSTGNTKGSTALSDSRSFEEYINPFPESSAGSPERMVGKIAHCHSI